MFVSGPSVAHEWLSRLPGLDRLWAITKGLPDVTVAVLDGPVDRSAVAVAAAGVVANGVVEHGTHVYSIISGSSDAVVPGIAPRCTILSIPIFDPAAGTGPSQICTQDNLAAGIGAALDQHANVINISASQQGDLLSLSNDLRNALQETVKRDVLVVAAAGNQGCACDTIPASVPGVLAVGAHADDGTPLLTSNWGPNHRTQGIVAPGSNIPGACVGGGLCRASGTSFATATVSGIAGLLMSVDVKNGLKPSGARTRRILLDSCVGPADDQIEMASTHLSGRMDVSRAVNLALGSAASVRSQEGTLTVNGLPTNETSEPEQAPRPETARSGFRSTAAGPAGVAPSPGLVPADCGCGCGGAAGQCTCGGAATKPQLVYAIGRLGVSFISQARRDAIWRTVNGKYDGDLKPISDTALKDLFRRQPFQAQSVVWTLSRTEVPMYAIVPTGAFSAETYKWLVDEWSDADVEFVSMPGLLAGQATLYDGFAVDVVVPDLRGMYSWQTKKYVKAIKDARKKANAKLSDDKIEREMNRFLGKIYFSIRNRGLTPEERALNAAATNAFNFSPSIVEAGEEGLTLRDVAVEKSPLNRPGSDYYDVLLTFFDPNDRQGRAPLRVRFTIDVSDTVPVMIGEPVSWNEY
jgi:cyanobactin maturation PatA/PatG family protease